MNRPQLPVFVVCLVLQHFFCSGWSLRHQYVSVPAFNSTLAPSAAPVPPLERVVRLHQSIKFPCNLPLLGSRGSLAWRHGGQRVSPMSAPRYSVDASGGLAIPNVRLEDAGIWQCLHTDAADALIAEARPIRLTVTDAPREVYLEVDGRRLDPGNVFLPVSEDSALSVWCAAEGGHPPPRLSWLLQGRPLATAAPHASRGRSEARLSKVARAMHNATLACTVHHEALHAPLNASVLLDVQYTPSFAITRSPGFGIPIVEGIPVSLKCDVDSNPPSTPLWVKDDGPPPVAQSADGFLNFSSIRREHSGWYKCTSRSASSIGYFLNVRYEESSTSEAESVSACPRGSLGCWRHGGADSILLPGAEAPTCERGRGSLPDLDRWRHDMMLQIPTPEWPRVVPARGEVVVSRGRLLTLSLQVCASPPPSRVLWLHNDTALAPGVRGHRLYAHPLAEGSSEHCQQAALSLGAASASVAGEYTLVVRSPRGVAEGSILVVVSGAPGGLGPLPLLLLILPCIHVYK